MRFSFPKATALMLGLLIATYCFKSSYATTLTNLAINKTATASSLEGANLPASAAVDNQIGTRWSSQFSDNQWISIDLGAEQPIGEVVINWEAAYAVAYKIEVSTDASTWITVKDITNGTGGKADFTFTPITARYVRMYGTARSGQYGYSIYEFEIYGVGVPASEGVWKLNGSSLYYPDGNIGIGTSTDIIEKLVVNGSIATIGTGRQIYLRENWGHADAADSVNLGLRYEGIISGKVSEQNANSNYLAWGLHLNALSWKWGQDKIYYHAGRHIFYTSEVIDSVFQKESIKMVIEGNGNVGIGTDSTGYYKLKVNGSVGITNDLAVSGAIKTKDLVVTTSGASSTWPDYVFTKEHKLPSIEQTEQFIKANGHLEGMPTKAQVAEKGVSVAELQAKLLEKVEELTLYVIDLKKENSVLKKQVKQLQGK